MDKRSYGIQTVYSFGFLCVLGAIIYYFASNWGYLARWEKLALPFGLLLIFYGLSVPLLKRPHRVLLGRLSLLGSCVSFGVGMAVIGQTYHSHADSWLLFAIWALSACAFSVMTRWQPMYLLAYGLGHTAYLLYFLSDGGVNRPEGQLVLVYAGLAAVQALLLVAVQKGVLHASAVRYTASAALTFFLWLLSNTLYFEKYGLLFNLPLALWLIGKGWLARRKQDRTELLLTGAAASVVIVLKYAEVAIQNWNDAFILWSLLFTAAYVAANVLWIKKVTAPGTRELSQTAEPPEPSEGWELPPSADNSRSFSGWFGKVIALSAVIVGTALGTLSLIAFVTEFVSPSKPEYTLAGAGLVLYTAALLASRWNPTVRYTLAGCGYCIGLGTGAFADQPLTLLLLAVLSALWFIRERGRVRRSFQLAAAAVAMGLALQAWTDTADVSLLALAGLLVLLAAASRLLPAGEARAVIRTVSGAGVLLLLFFLTYCGRGTVNLVYNALFIVIVLSALTASIRLRIVWFSRYSFALWALYVAVKYYDTAWKLLHKSVSLALLGILVMGAAWLVERRGLAEASRQPEEALPSVRRLLMMAGILVLVQAAVMSVQIGKSEWLLRHGSTVKLELAPRDPRSLLQGDYVELRYKISELVRTGSSAERKERVGRTVSVLLRPDTGGVYQAVRILEAGEQPGSGEVAIKGKLTYDGVRYGIEEYFVKEGTGRETELTAKYAEVRVSRNGDAILVRLLNE